MGQRQAQAPSWRLDLAGECDLAEPRPADPSSFVLHWFSAIILGMGQNETERGARNAVLNGRLGDFAGYCLAVDCGAAQCGGERGYSIDAAVPAVQWPSGACYIETRSQLATRGRMRRLALIGPEIRGDRRCFMVAGPDLRG
jgi:hypothetical protein